VSDRPLQVGNYVSADTARPVAAAAQRDLCRRRGHSGSGRLGGAPTGRLRGPASLGPGSGAGSATGSTATSGSAAATGSSAGAAGAADSASGTAAACSAITSATIDARYVSAGAGLRSLLGGPFGAVRGAGRKLSRAAAVRSVWSVRSRRSGIMGRRVEAAGVGDGGVPLSDAGRHDGPPPGGPHRRRRPRHRTMIRTREDAIGPPGRHSPVIRPGGRCATSPNRARNV
jgi:hypothetical protein